MIKMLHGRWLLILIVCWCSILFTGGQMASADDAIYSPAYLGRYQTREDTDGSVTESVVGVRVRLQAGGQKELLAGGVDTWKKGNGGSWEYMGSEVNGEQGKFKTKIGNSTMPIGVLSDSGPRFALFPHVIKNRLAKEGVKEYSIVTKTSSNGKQIGQYAEFSFQTQEELVKNPNSLMYSLRGNLDYLKLSSYSAEGISYDYMIYPSYPIQSSGKVSLDAGQCTVAKEGKVFYNGSHYYIKELPQLAAPNGYSVQVEGWYDQKEGGTKYEEGSLIASSKTLHPHYTLTKNQYTVTCLDVIESEQGLLLGSSHWQQTYQTTATGAQAGVIPLADTYYKGVCYVGCSTQVVGETGTTVYRYFRYADYPVTVVDMVNTGSNEGRILGSTSTQGSYQKLVSGGSLSGNVPTESLYYSGYVYHGESSARVDTAGTTVYRYFRPVTYNICFDGNGATEGSMAPLTNCEYDSSVTLPLHVYRNSVKVTFDLQSDDATYEMGEMVLERPFGGWSEKIDGKTAHADGDLVKNLCNISGEKVLYANWNRAELKTESCPKRLGYRFVGWSENPDDTQGKSAILLSEDTTLYAIWNADIAEYHVEYYKESFDGLFEKSDSYTFRGYMGKNITLDRQEQQEPGYYMDASSSVLSGSIKGDGSLVLKVVYRRNTYTLQFELEGGTLDKAYPTLSGKFEESIQLPAVIPTREHYEFAGWTAEQGSSQIYCKAGELYHIPNHNQTLYAVWKPHTYLVQYMDEGEQVISERDYAIDEDIVLPDCETKKDGYRFAGWKLSPEDTNFYPSGQTVKALTCENGAVRKIYAVWKPANNTPFVLQLSKEGLHGEKEQKERIALRGDSGQFVREAVFAHYQTQKIEELFHGFTVANPEAMDIDIEEDGTTIVELKLLRRTYHVMVVSDFKENVVYYQTSCLFGDTVSLPEELAETNRIARFEDENHVCYPAGGTVTVSDNLILIPQHLIQYRLDNRILETHYVRHNGYEKAVQPEEKGYQFDGWYGGDGNAIRYYSAGETLQVKTDMCLEGKWSETRRKFQIRYELGQYAGVVALEEFTSDYQFGDTVLLPRKTQLYIPDKYTFIGWYEQGDSKRNIITEITPDKYGHKLYCLLLEEKKEDDCDGQEKPSTPPSESPVVKQPTPTDDVKPQNSKAPEDSPNPTGKSEVTLPINRKTKNASGNSEKKMQEKIYFTKQNVTYCVVSAGKKQVAVANVGRNLRTVKLASKVIYNNTAYRITKIASKAFYKHPSLKRITIGNKVLSIGASAFAGAKKLQTVTMGKSVRQIAPKAFYGTKSLKKVVFNGKQPQRIGKQAFTKTNKKLKVRVPKSCVKKYRNILKKSSVKRKQIVT